LGKRERKGRGCVWSFSPVCLLRPAPARVVGPARALLLSSIAPGASARTTCGARFFVPLPVSRLSAQSLGTWNCTSAPKTHGSTQILFFRQPQSRTENGTSTHNNHPSKPADLATRPRPQILGLVPELPTPHSCSLGAPNPSVNRSRGNQSWSLPWPTRLAKVPPACYPPPPHKTDDSKLRTATTRS